MSIRALARLHTFIEIINIFLLTSSEVGQLSVTVESIVGESFQG